MLKLKLLLEQYWELPNNIKHKKTTKKSPKTKKNKTSISTASISNSDINLNETIRDSQPTTSSKNIKKQNANWRKDFKFILHH